MPTNVNETPIVIHSKMLRYLSIFTMGVSVIDEPDPAGSNSFSVVYVFNKVYIVLLLLRDGRASNESCN